ncbi:hypothetical protein [Desulfosediminicola ganghwensis]|uniref:hypothetical protein n=1 Tax=Desulfosediminicola ganghwensis TaxID=2569540 RepID=UPI0010AD8B0F|nr:hypothetical protein [Desulfosediminicola ganghwensis]
MILYDQSIPASLQEVGIQIPVRDSRLTKTFQALLDEPELQARQAELHQPRIVERLEREDLLRRNQFGTGHVF